MVAITCVVVALCALLAFAAICCRFVKLKNKTNGVFLEIEALLKKRYDLLPILFDAIREHMDSEKALFKEASSLRTLAMRTHEADAKLQLDSQLIRALNAILLSIEHYPRLKTDEGVLKLLTELSDIEDKINAARGDYNKNANDYNNAMEMIPTNILAFILKYKKRALYEA
jgi:LemA protein